VFLVIRNGILIAGSIFHIENAGRFRYSATVAERTDI